MTCASLRNEPSLDLDNFRTRRISDFADHVPRRAVFHPGPCRSAAAEWECTRMQLAFCTSRTELASLLQREGRLEEAEQLVRESLRIRRLQPKTQQFRTAQDLEELVSILVSAGRIDEADRAFAEAL